MDKMYRILFGLTFSSSDCYAQMNYSVAMNDNKGNNGTEEAPFATIERL